MLFIRFCLSQKPIVPFKAVGIKCENAEKWCPVNEMGIIAGNQLCFFGFISQSAPKSPKFKSEQTIIINSAWIFIPRGMSQPLSISLFLYRLGCQLPQRVQMLSTNLGNNSPSSVIHLGKNTSSAPFKSACTLVIDW